MVEVLHNVVTIHLFLTLHSMTSCWQIEIAQDGRLSPWNSANVKNPGFFLFLFLSLFFFFPGELVDKHLSAYFWVRSMVSLVILIVIAKYWKQTKCLSIGSLFKKKLWVYPHNIVFCSSSKEWGRLLYTNSYTKEYWTEKGRSKISVSEYWVRIKKKSEARTGLGKCYLCVIKAGE